MWELSFLLIFLWKWPSAMRGELLHVRQEETLNEYKIVLTNYSTSGFDIREDLWDYLKVDESVADYIQEFNFLPVFSTAG